MAIINGKPETIMASKPCCIQVTHAETAGKFHVLTDTSLCRQRLATTTNSCIQTTTKMLLQHQQQQQDHPFQGYFD
jgi:hypothetical protein